MIEGNQFIDMRHTISMEDQRKHSIYLIDTYNMFTLKY